MVLEVTSKKQLEELIQKEKDGITKDSELRQKFVDVATLLDKTKQLRDLQNYLGEHQEVLSELADISKFKDRIWKSYFKVHYELYNDLVREYQKTEKKEADIVAQANKERTQWEEVIDIFNGRFIVPFTLEIKNKASVMLGDEKIATLSFAFVEEPGQDPVPVERNSLLNVLSTGEKRAFYLLNIIFEIQARKKSQQETLLIIDDIADSFDYKNKYAIIQYLKEISDDPCFKQIILTHNFDFFRTVNKRFVGHPHSYMAIKQKDKISLELAKGIHTPFSDDWRLCFFDDPKKKIASIPFVRNLIEYTKGKGDPEFVKLTSLLHWKKDSESITIKDLDDIFGALCCKAVPGQHNGTGRVVDLVQSEAHNCLTASNGINLENKVVLSIAIRLVAEKFMVAKINDENFIDGITSNQTYELLAKFKTLFSTDVETIKALDLVALMTPENIHLNSFMYEPILDMSDEHLRRLYSTVLALK